MKKLLAYIVLVLVLGGSGGVAVARDFSLIVAPSRFNVIQVLFDIIDQRPAVLVSYQGEASTPNPSLHVWNGVNWNPIGLHDLRELSFLQQTPKRAILVGDDALLPVAIRDGLSWMPEVVYIRQLENAALLNEFGRVFNWSNREWRWFARRYNLDLEDEAAPLRRSSWYDQTGPIPRTETFVPSPAAPSAPVQSFEPPPAPVMAPPPPSRPSDLPAPPPPPPPASSGDLDELIQTLERARAPAPEAASAVGAQESFPIK
ncbi:MAG TPA: hypothetical protein PKE26_02330 [Kiritimatiellia bacterium]|nr:hypothetical protein [Kiritimatiellia bacterium]HMO97925.1 hypothetical protein [Kiritimatiellia bacterium]HMP95276.1 hypothetical protein [Kiritimatiellia bacterium]